MPRSTFYYQQKAAQACDKYAGLKKQIATIYALHKGWYGYRRITLAIRQLGEKVMESFFAVLKTEFFYLNKFGSVDELQRGIKKYIHYYNHDRIKLKLQGLSPVQYRTQPWAT